MKQRRPTRQTLLMGLTLAAITGCGAVGFLRSDPSLPRDRASRFDRFASELALDLRDTAPLLDRIRLSPGPPEAAGGGWSEERRIFARRSVVWNALQRVDGEFSAEKFSGQRAATSRIIEDDLRRILGVSDTADIDRSAAAPPADANGLMVKPGHTIQRLAATPWSGVMVEAPSVLLAEHPSHTASDLAAWEQALYALAAEGRFLAAPPAALASTEIYDYPPFILDLLLDDIVKLQSSAGAGGAQDPLLGPLLEAASQLPGPDSRSQSVSSSARRQLQRELSLELNRLVEALDEMKSRQAKLPFNGSDSLRTSATDEWLSRMRDSAGIDVDPVALADLGRAEVLRLKLPLGQVLGLDPAEPMLSGLLAEGFAAIRDRELSSPGADEPQRSPRTLWDNLEPRLEELVADGPPVLVRSRVARAFERPHGRWSPFIRGNLTPVNDPLARAAVFLTSRERDPTTPYWLREAEALRYGIPGRAVLDAYRRAARDDISPYLLQAERETFEEGWSLYAVSAAADAGLLLELDEGFGRLVQELIVFVSLVTDVGLNATGWTVQQAVDYILESTPLPRSAARELVARIVADPGRVALPAIGLLRLRTLRRSAETLTGENFSAPEFHAALLKGGPIPMDEIDARIEAWLDRRGSKSGQ